MGVDYIRFHPRPEADPLEIATLVRQQALAFQSMPGWRSGPGRVESLTWRLLEKLHLAAYREASARLKSLIVLPDWDDERRCSPDMQELAPSWRVYPITYRSIFPPLWRVRAYRTILPDELSGQIAQWRAWLDEVQRGERDAIVHRLWLFSNSDSLREHWSELRDVAACSLKRTAAWAQKPELDEVRRQILMLPEPIVVDVPLDEFEPLPPLDEAAESTLREAIDRTCALTKSWNRLVRSNAKVRGGHSGYVHSLEESKPSAATTGWTSSSPGLSPAPTGDSAFFSTTDGRSAAKRSPSHSVRGKPCAHPAAETSAAATAEIDVVACLLRASIRVDTLSLRWRDRRSSHGVRGRSSLIAPHHSEIALATHHLPRASQAA